MGKEKGHVVTLCTLVALEQVDFWSPPTLSTFGELTVVCANKHTVSHKH